jgi:hypothetical protein
VRRTAPTGPRSPAAGEPADRTVGDGGQIGRFIFPKKSKKGIKTPVAEMTVIRRRLKAAEEHYGERRAEEERRQADPH